MAFLNIFKKSASSADARTSRKEQKEIAKETRKKIVTNVLSLPHISEKAGMLQAQNKYVFKVMPRATKYGVKASVEEQYGVLVKKIAMIRVSAKSIRVGKRMGEKQGYKKAVVTLKEGYKIETISS